MLSVAAALAMPPARAPGQPPCPPCEVRLEPLATLRSDRLTLRKPALALGADRHGRFFLADGFDAGELLVFDSAARWTRTLGRPGAGPGEFRGIAGILPDHGDSLIVLDRATARLTILGPDGAFVRSAPLPSSSPHHALRLPGRGIVLTVSDPRSAPIHLIGFEGAILATFGERGSLERRGVSTVASLDGRTLWSAPSLDYVLDQWDPGGSLLHTIRRDPVWFRPDPAARPGPPDRVRPQPRLHLVQPAGSDRLWVVGVVAAAGWRPAGPQVRGEGPPIPPLTELVRFFDTVVELIEVPSGRLLASARFPNGMLDGGCAGCLALPVEREDGEPEVRVFRLTLVAR